MSDERREEEEWKRRIVDDDGVMKEVHERQDGKIRRVVVRIKLTGYEEHDDVYNTRIKQHATHDANITYQTHDEMTRSMQQAR